MTTAGPETPARVVLGANTLVSAIIGGTKAPPAAIRRAVDAALAGASVVLVCPRLLDEVEAVLGRPKMRRYVATADIPALMTWLLTGSRLVDDPTDVPRVCRDPRDDYLCALADAEEATIVSGDDDLLALRGVATMPIMTAREYLLTLG